MMHLVWLYMRSSRTTIMEDALYDWKSTEARSLTTATIFRFHSISTVCVPASHKNNLQTVHARAKSLIFGIELQLVALVRTCTEEANTIRV